MRSTRGHAKHVNTIGWSGSMPPGNFEKLHSLRLNLRAFLVIYHPLMLLWTQVNVLLLPACLYPCSYSAIVYLNNNFVLLPAIAINVIINAIP